MSHERSYERLDFNEYFIKFIQVHPQLQYFNDEKDLLNLQQFLYINYNNNILTKEDVINIYNNYIEKKRNELIDINNYEFESKQKLIQYKKYKQNITNNFIKDLIKENKS